MSAGFQMSFAATAALVALVEAWPKRTREIAAPMAIMGVQRAGTWITAAVAASVVAGLATGPFAMQHFNRTPMYGLVANLGASPVADFVLMPALAVGAALEPLGLGGPFLAVAGWGVDVMLAIGQWTAGLPGAVRNVASAPDFVLPIAFLGVLFICLWQGRLRWLGLPFAAAVLLWPRAPTPDLWISDGGANAAFSRDRRAVTVRPGVRTYAVDMWARRRGLAPVDRGTEGWICTRQACAPTPRRLARGAVVGAGGAGPRPAGQPVSLGPGRQRAGRRPGPADLMPGQAGPGRRRSRTRRRGRAMA